MPYQDDTKAILCQTCGTTRVWKGIGRLVGTPAHIKSCPKDPYCREYTVSENERCTRKWTEEVDGKKVCGIHAKMLNRRSMELDRYRERREQQEWVREETQRYVKELTELLGLPDGAVKMEWRGPSYVPIEAVGYTGSVVVSPQALLERLRGLEDLQEWPEDDTEVPRLATDGVGPVGSDADGGATQEEPF